MRQFLRTIFRAVAGSRPPNFTVHQVRGGALAYQCLSASDRQKLLHLFTAVSALVFCAPDLANFYEFYISADEQFCKKILDQPDHILRVLLPPRHRLLYRITILPLGLSSCSEKVQCPRQRATNKVSP